MDEAHENQNSQRKPRKAHGARTRYMAVKGPPLNLFALRFICPAASFCPGQTFLLAQRVQLSIALC